MNKWQDRKTFLRVNAEVNGILSIALASCKDSQSQVVETKRQYLEVSSASKIDLEVHASEYVCEVAWDTI